MFFLHSIRLMYITIQSKISLYVMKYEYFERWKWKWIKKPINKNYELNTLLISNKKRFNKNCMNPMLSYLNQHSFFQMYNLYVEYQVSRIFLKHCLCILHSHVSTFDRLKISTDFIHTSVESETLL